MPRRNNLPAEWHHAEDDPRILQRGGTQLFLSSSGSLCFGISPGSSIARIRMTTKESRVDAVLVATLFVN